MNTSLVLLLLISVKNHLAGGSRDRTQEDQWVAAAIAQVRAELDRFKTEWKGRQDDDLGWGARREGKESGVTHRVLTWMMA